MVAQIWKPYPDEPDYRRAGGADYRPGQGHPAFRVIHKLTGGLADQLGGPSHLVHLVKAHFLQACQYIVDVVQVVELAIQGGGGQSNGIPEFAQSLHVGKPGPFGVVGTYANALPTVDAPLCGDKSLALPYADGLGRAALHTVGTAHAFFFF